MKLEMKCKGKECHNAKLKFSSRGAFRASLNFHEDDVFNNPFNHGQYQEKHMLRVYVNCQNILYKKYSMTFC